jgi:hypothetical protein
MGRRITMDFEYEILEKDRGCYNKGVTINKYYGEANSLVIPSEIQGIPVRTICPYAFEDCDSLTEISIPASVMYIDYSAFKHSINLLNIYVDKENEHYADIDGVLYYKDMSILFKYPEAKTEETFTIPNTVETVTRDAFEGCKKLKSIIIPNSVTDFDGIENCENITEITIPDSVSGYCSFHGCKKLKGIHIGKDNINYSSIDGVLFDKNKNVLYKYPEGKTEETYTIPDSVIEISPDAFNGCVYLKELVIPDFVTIIYGYSFLSRKNIINYGKGWEAPKGMIARPFDKNIRPLNIYPQVVHGEVKLKSMSISRNTKIKGRPFPDTVQIVYRD